MTPASQKLYSRMRQEGYKITGPRKRIIETLLENQSKHYTIEELYDEINQKRPSIGLATVYRTVNTLCELEILAKLELADGYDRYELKDDAHHHHHLICENCGRVIEVREDFLDELEEKIERTYQFQVLGHMLKFYGLCGTCFNKRTEKL